MLDVPVCVLPLASSASTIPDGARPGISPVFMRRRFNPGRLYTAADLSPRTARILLKNFGAPVATAATPWGSPPSSLRLRLVTCSRKCIRGPDGTRPPTMLAPPNVPGNTTTDFAHRACISPGFRTVRTSAQKQCDSGVTSVMSARVTLLRDSSGGFSGSLGRPSEFAGSGIALGRGCSSTG